MPLTIQLLDQMLYLNAFIREVFFREEDNGRTLMEDTVIGDYWLPKGVSLEIRSIFSLINKFLFLRCKLSFPPLSLKYVTDAAAFRPARWLKPHQGGFEGILHPVMVHACASEDVLPIWKCKFNYRNYYISHYNIQSHLCIHRRVCCVWKCPKLHSVL